MDFRGWKRGPLLRQTSAQVGSSELKRNYRGPGVLRMTIYPRAPGVESKMGLIYYRGRLGPSGFLLHARLDEMYSLNRSDRKRRQSPDDVKSDYGHLHTKAFLAAQRNNVRALFRSCGVAVCFHVRVYGTLI